MRQRNKKKTANRHFGRFHGNANQKHKLNVLKKQALLVQAEQIETKLQQLEQQVNGYAKELDKQAALSNPTENQSTIEPTQPITK